jgi:FkbM family methyltransferase
MHPVVRKSLRTLQSHLPGIVDAKNLFYLHARRFLKRPHEPDFSILRNFPAGSQECFIDVGANHGQSIESILLYNKNAPIVSFEPNPDLTARLRKRYRHMPNIDIRDYGLADRESNFDLYVPSYRGYVYDGLASFDYEAASSWLNSERMFFFNAKRLSVEKLTCSAQTLDSQKLTPVFIKIDVQGYEYQVLKGGIHTLQKSGPVILLENPAQDHRILDLLMSLDYEEYYCRDGILHKGSGPDGNSLFITRSKLGTFT